MATVKLGHLTLVKVDSMRKPKPKGIIGALERYRDQDALVEELLDAVDVAKDAPPSERPTVTVDSAARIERVLRGLRRLRKDGGL